MASKRRYILGAAALLLFLGCGQGGEQSSEQSGGSADIPLDVTFETAQDTVFYALGLGLSNFTTMNLSQPQPLIVELTEADLEAIFEGMSDMALDKEPRIAVEEYGEKMKQWITQRQGAEGTPPPSVEAGEDDANTLYAMGQAIGGTTFISPLKGKWTLQQLGQMRKGFFDASLKREPMVELQAYGPQATEYLRGQLSALVEDEKALGKAFLDKAAQEEGAVVTETGLVYQELVAGTGDAPTVEDVIKINYEGALIDGTVFDSTFEKGEPLTYQLKGFIAGWQQGLTMMKEGGKAKLVIPSDLAYGDGGNPPVIPPGATLVFQIELLEIIDTSAAPTDGASGE